MRITQVAGGGYEANQFLAVADGEAMLVDVGTGLAIPNTLRGVDRALDGATLQRIYLTHWHVDHVGAAAAMHDALGVELVMPEAEAHAVRDGRGDLTLSQAYGAPMPAAPVRGVQPGGKIQLGGETFEVLHTPGHTAGHTSLWHAPSRSLIAGDAVFADGAFGRVDLPTGHAGEMVDTLTMLSGLGVENLYPGHMRIVEGSAHKHIEMARDAVESMGWSRRGR